MEDRLFRKKRLSPEARREEFIEKAAELFAEEGFSVSTRDLARELNVTQPLLYRYFPSKEALLEEVYERVLNNRWRTEWEEILVERSRSLRARLVEIYQEYTEVVFERDKLRIFLFAGLKDGSVQRRYFDRISKQLVTPIMAEYRHEKGLAEGEPSSEETALVWSMHGAIYQQGIRVRLFNEISNEDLSHMIEEAIDDLLRKLDAMHG